MEAQKPLAINKQQLADAIINIYNRGDKATLAIMKKSLIVKRAAYHMDSEEYQTLTELIDLC